MIVTECVGLKGWLATSAVAARALALLACASACSPFDGIRAQSDPIQGDAGPQRTALEPGCTFRRPPGPPSFDDVDASTEDEPSFTLVAHDLDFGDGLAEDGRPSHQTLGFDIDGVCTTEHDGHACSVAAWATSSPLRITDGDDGIDNAVGAAYADFVRTGTPSATWGANLNVDSGQYANLLRIEGYNGLANDRRVRVAVTGAIFVPPPGAAYTGPTWQGTDEWQGVHRFFEGELEQDSTEEILPFKYVDEGAYVSEFQLVVHLRHLYDGFGTHNDVQLSARLVRDPALGWMLQRGTASARVDVESLLKIIGATYGLEDNGGASSDTTPDATRVCIGHPMYETRKRVVCSLADVSYDGQDARSSLCDAVSWGWGFEATPAKLVGVRKYDLEFKCPVGLRPGIDDHCDPSLNDGGAP